MIPRRTASTLCTAAALGLLPLVLAHGGGHGSQHSDFSMETGGGSMNMTVPSHNIIPEDITTEGTYWEPSYFGYSEYSAWMYGHIVTMIVGWCMVLPIAVMLSIARSRLAYPLQTLFVTINAIGTGLAIVYRANVPDLYEGNVHYKMGWLFTWAALAWLLLSLTQNYARSSAETEENKEAVSAANVAYHNRIQQQKETASPDRWSRDSGLGGERNSASLFGSTSSSPDLESESRSFDIPLQSSQLPANDIEVDEDGLDEVEENQEFLSSNIKVGRPVPKGLFATAASRRLFSLAKGVHVFLERSMLILGWFALTTGVIVFSGIMRDSELLNGLAHFIKGSIFFWYGLLTLGRWAGAFADVGWAWNIKPPASLIGRFRAWTPSGEFTESFVLFLYGITNVWLEHLDGWGGKWQPNDLEHISITLLFAGGGLLGMLAESTRLRSLLQSSLSQLGRDDVGTPVVRTHFTQINYTPASYEAEQPDAWSQPHHYSVPLNPLPALVILLLGYTMSSHTQHSMISSMLHSQWGNLLMGFSLARFCTYLLLYLKPYSSHLPSRPPTELITSFCLTAGGLLFISSGSAIVQGLEYWELDTMFVFMVAAGFSAMLMAWIVVLLAILGLARRGENARSLHKSLSSQTVVQTDIAA